MDENLQNAPLVEQANKKDERIGKALSAFIVSFVGVISSISVILCVPGVVLGIIGLAFSNQAKGVTKKPFVGFQRASKPLSIVAIVLGAFITLALTVVAVVFAILGIIKYVNKA